MPPLARPLVELDPTQVTSREGVLIGKGGARDLTGDLYLPPAGGDAWPGLVILHGGGWWKGSTRGVKGYGQLLSRMGFVCLCPDYRLSGEAQWPAQIEDVKCAIRYLRANHDELGLDPDRVGIIGDSAGGHLALMTGVAADFEGTGGHQGYSSAIKAVAATYAPIRVPRRRSDGEPTGLMEPGASDADYDAASPISYDLAEFPPCLLIHGTADAGVPLAGTLELYEALTGRGRPVDLHLFAEEGHAFDRRAPGQERMVDVADPSSIYGLTIVRIVGHFFSKYL